MVWCGGMRAHPLAAAVPGGTTASAGLRSIAFSRCLAIHGVFAAGDCAAALVDGEHASVMSCQHARPMGRIAGHNVVCDLIGETPIPIDIGYYVTILDLGALGCRLHRGLGPQGRGDRGGGEGNQAPDQPAADLSAALARSGRNPRRSGAGHAGTAAANSRAPVAPLPAMREGEGPARQGWEGEGPYSRRQPSPAFGFASGILSRKRERISR